MTTKGTLRRISPAELDEILIQVHQEGYRELVLLGPEIRLSPSPEDWPDELKSRSILQLTESVAGLAERLLDLNQLQLLTLHGNQIGEAGAGAIAEHPTGLTSLDLRGNSNLKSMNAFSNLSMLRKLIISETGVTDLSPLKGLIERGLPVKWEEYPFGHGIAVYDCPLVKPTPEVINQGREAVLNYFREIEAQEIDRLYEAKVLILGEGGAGKTSLVRRLYFPDQPLPTEDETTRGIEVYLQEFFTSENRTFRLNVWDFGGQQIYHATHQFFFTKSSLYVLVDDTRKDHKMVHDEGFKYWLKVVEALSERSPLLIFQNEKSGRSKQIDEAGIKGRFPNVLEIYRGDLEKADSSDRPLYP